MKESEIVSPVGCNFTFEGLERNRDSIRGWENTIICWLEEGQAISNATAEVLIPTLFREKNPELWVTWNPTNRSDWVYRRFVTSPAPGDIHFHTTWKDNPWFPPGLEEERVRCLSNNPERYPHIWMGEPDDGDATSRLLPYAIVRQCYEGWGTLTKEEREEAQSGVTYAGYDPAGESHNNYHALTVRRGAVVLSTERWHGTRRESVARIKARHEATGGFRELFYDDGGGYGVGLRDELNPIKSQPVLFGSAVTGPNSTYMGRTSNRDRFARRNAQLAWELRLRAMKTNRRLQGEDIPVGECLWLPYADEDLMVELSQPTYREGSAGKVEVKKMNDKAEEDSPDMYDSVALAFAHESRNGIRVGAHYKVVNRNMWM